MKDLKMYSHDELIELIQWFDGKVIPASIQLDKATYIPDVKETLSRLAAQAEIGYENPKLQGAIFLLERLKAKLEETQK